MDERVRIDRYEVRLVEMGYVQKEGAHHDETFLPVIPFDVLLPIVGRHTSACWHVHQADISTAFLKVYVDGEL